MIRTAASVTARFEAKKGTYSRRQKSTSSGGSQKPACVEGRRSREVASSEDDLEQRLGFDDREICARNFGSGINEIFITLTLSLEERCWSVERLRYIDFYGDVHCGLTGT